ncbi:MAG: phytoene desaturase family protein [Chloroflexota bacterium]
MLFDLTPRPLLRVAGHRLSATYRRKLTRYRYGPGVCKVDYALAGPVPWRAAACRRAVVVHVGGTTAEIAAAERAVWEGRHPERPFVIAAQQSLWDPTRAPAGRHTLWAYCHVPGGSARDVTDAIDTQIERFAPGFRDLVLARHVRTALQVERENPNFVGGDINGGVQDWRQVLARPVAGPTPYATPAEGIYICSSATPPGGGVHGMCGYWAAQTALRNELSR